MTDSEIIAHYGAGVIRAIDGRGRARNEAELYRALLPNTTPTIPGSQQALRAGWARL